MLFEDRNSCSYHFIRLHLKVEIHDVFLYYNILLAKHQTWIASNPRRHKPSQRHYITYCQTTSHYMQKLCFCHHNFFKSAKQKKVDMPGAFQLRYVIHMDAQLFLSNEWMKLQLTTRISSAMSVQAQMFKQCGAVAEKPEVYQETLSASTSQEQRTHFKT